jgi:ABC-type dipeptide/oligopeptide/nickel transport system permease component
MSVETTVNTIVIRLMNNSGAFQETETSAETVGELRTSLGLDGTIVVNNVTYAGDRVSHVSGNKRGGK